jgi:Predicted membrane protein (DUF2142)
MPNGRRSSRRLASESVTDGKLRDAHARGSGQEQAQADAKEAHGRSAKVDGRGTAPTGRGVSRAARVWRDALSLVLLAGLGGFIAACFWPGHMNADTLNDINEVRTGSFSNHHAPILNALWRPFYELGIGPGWVLAGQILTFLLGMYLILRGPLRPFAAAGATALIAISPMVLGALGLLGRDTWFAAFVLVAFGCVTQLASRSPEERVRIAWILLALVSSWLALASRQNAAPAVLIILAVLAFLALSDRRRSSERLARLTRTPLRLGATSAILGGAVTLVLMGTVFATATLMDLRDVNPETTVYVYDLAGISHRERENLFPPEIMRERGLAAVERSYDPDNWLAYAVGPTASIKPVLNSREARMMSESWRQAISDHPGAYLDTRLDMFLRQIGLTRKASVIYHPGIDGNTFVYSIRFSGLNQTLRDYLDLFGDDDLEGGPVFRVWLYLLGAILALVLMFRYRRERLAVVGLGLAAVPLLYQVGLFFLAMGVGYRLQFPAVALALIAMVYAAAVFWRTRRSRMSAAAPFARQ